MLEQKKIDPKKIVCIIPARLNSSRFPKKILTNLANKPLLQWVWEAATKTTFFHDVVFAIDSEETAQKIKSFGGKYIMTSTECKSGTDRLVEIVIFDKLEADIYVNWQADEPFITPDMIKTLLKTCNTNDADIWTLKKRIIKPEDITSHNIAKVVCNIDDYALYFSRSTIPYYRDKSENQIYFKHVGIYAYTVKALRAIAEMGSCYTEDAEKLEQLRFLHNKLLIKVHQTDQEVIGIDTPEDLQKAEDFVKNNLKTFI